MGYSFYKSDIVMGAMKIYFFGGKYGSLSLKLVIIPISTFFLRLSEVVFHSFSIFIPDFINCKIYYISLFFLSSISDKQYHT